MNRPSNAFGYGGTAGWQAEIELVAESGDHDWHIIRYRHDDGYTYEYRARQYACTSSLLHDAVIPLLVGNLIEARTEPVQLGNRTYYDTIITIWVDDSDLTQAEHAFQRSVDLNDAHTFGPQTGDTVTLFKKWDGRAAYMTKFQNGRMYELVHVIGYPRPKEALFLVKELAAAPIIGCTTRNKTIKLTYWVEYGT